MERTIALAPIVYAHDPAGPDTVKTFSAVAHSLLQRPEAENGGLTWSFPSSLLEQPHGEMNETLTRIRARVAAGQDIVAPCGYSGAHHGALLGVELERELSWAVRNSWGSGLGAEFPGKERILFSTRIDLAREEALPRYTGACSTMIAGLQHAGLDPLCELMVYSGTVLRRMPAEDLSSVRLLKRGPLRSMARTIVRSHLPLVAVLIPAERTIDVAGVERFFRLLDLLTRRGTLNLTAIRTDIVAQCAPDYHAVPEIQPAAEPRMTPDLLRTVHSVATFRKGRVTVDATRRVLIAIAHEEAPTVEFPTVAHEPREYVASMIGTATIADDTMGVTFDGGVLCGVSGEDGQLLPGYAVPGWVETGKRRRPLVVSSAFSFEAEHSRGLSTFSTTDDAAGAAGVRMDAISAAGYPWLLVDMQVSTPSPDHHTRSMSPFVLPITECSRGQGIEVESIYPDGEAAMTYIEVGKDEKVTTVWGSVLRLRWNDRVLSLGFPALYGKTIAPVTMRIIQIGKRRFCAEMHPAGFFRACGSEQLTGRAYSLTFCLAPGEPDPASVLRPPELIHRCLLPAESRPSGYPRIFPFPSPPDS